jgi:hypothetical protein
VATTTSAAASDSINSVPSSSHHSNSGTIVAAVVVPIVVLLIAAAAIAFFIWKRKKDRYFFNLKILTSHFFSSGIELEKVVTKNSDEHYAPMGNRSSITYSKVDIQIETLLGAGNFGIHSNEYTSLFFRRSLQRKEKWRNCRIKKTQVIGWLARVPKRSQCFMVIISNVTILTVFQLFET